MHALHAATTTTTTTLRWLAGFQGQVSAALVARSSLSCTLSPLCCWPGLQDPATAAVLERALAQPEAFVLKPQREGGGNNLYGNCV